MRRASLANQATTQMADSASGESEIVEFEHVSLRWIAPLRLSGTDLLAVDMRRVKVHFATTSKESEKAVGVIAAWAPIAGCQYTVPGGQAMVTFAGKEDVPGQLNRRRRIAIPMLPKVAASSAGLNCRWRRGALQMADAGAHGCAQLAIGRCGLPALTRSMRSMKVSAMQGAAPLQNPLGPDKYRYRSADPAMALRPADHDAGFRGS